MVVADTALCARKMIQRESLLAGRLSRLSLTGNRALALWRTLPAKPKRSGILSPLAILIA
jgi:hypothetical protein